MCYKNGVGLLNKNNLNKKQGLLIEADIDFYLMLKSMVKIFNRKQIIINIRNIHEEYRL
jgi:hypothetical protein